MKAPAKINLLLRVLSARKDGHHDIESIMQAIDLCDEVEIETCDTGDASYEIICKTEGASLPEGKGNLAYCAAQIFLEKYKINCNVNIRLTKRIPVAAGLAGGSADAAAVLLALAAKHTPGRPLAELASLGVNLGADVPFQIYTCAKINPSFGYESESFCTALARGIGENLTPLKPSKTAYIVLVNPGFFISAGEAYQLFDICGETSMDKNVSDISVALESGEEFDILSLLANDLMQPVAGKYQDLNSLIEKMDSLCKHRGGRSMMSGSGPTVFGLFYNEDEASKAFDNVQTTFPGMFSVLVRTL